MHSFHANVFCLFTVGNNKICLYIQYIQSTLETFMFSWKTMALLSDPKLLNHSVHVFICSYKYEITNICAVSDF